MTKPFTIHPATLVVASLALGGVAGWLDIHSREVQPAVLVLAFAGAGLGFLSPRSAWIPAFLVGVGVPLAHVYAHSAGVSLPYAVDGGIPATFLALIPSTLGAVAGAVVRAMWLARGATPHA